jgi:hypothetical protein
MVRPQRRTFCYRNLAAAHSLLGAAARTILALVF